MYIIDTPIKDIIFYVIGLQMRTTYRLLDDHFKIGQVYYALAGTEANLPRTCGASTAKKLVGERVNGGAHCLFQPVENGRGESLYLQVGA